LRGSEELRRRLFPSLGEASAHPCSKGSFFHPQNTNVSCVPAIDLSDAGAVNATRNSIGQDQGVNQGGLEAQESEVGSTSSNLNTNDSTGNVGNRD